MTNALHGKALGKVEDSSNGQSTGDGDAQLAVKSSEAEACRVAKRWPGRYR